MASPAPGGAGWEGQRGSPQGISGPSHRRSGLKATESVWTQATPLGTDFRQSIMQVWLLAVLGIEPGISGVQVLCSAAAQTPPPKGDISDPGPTLGESKATPLPKPGRCQSPQMPLFRIPPNRQRLVWGQDPLPPCLV